MVQLCLSPKTAYRHTSYNKQTKNHWARDDPAFVVICCGLVAAAAFVYCLMCARRGVAWCDVARRWSRRAAGGGLTRHTRLLTRLPPPV